MGSRRDNLLPHVISYCPDELSSLEEFAALPAGPDDVVFLPKQYCSSNLLAQKPVLMMPESFLPRLLSTAIVILDKNTLSGRTVAEFRKTALEVIKPPWRLERAHDYIQGLLELNKAIHHNVVARDGLPLKFIWSDYKLTGPQAALCLPPGEQGLFAPEGLLPRLVAMHKVSRPTKRRRQNEDNSADQM